MSEANLGPGVYVDGVRITDPTEELRVFAKWMPMGDYFWEKHGKRWWLQNVNGSGRIAETDDIEGVMKYFPLALKLGKAVPGLLDRIAELERQINDGNGKIDTPADSELANYRPLPPFKFNLPDNNNEDESG